MRVTVRLVVGRDSAETLALRRPLKEALEDTEALREKEEEPEEVRLPLVLRLPVLLTLSVGLTLMEAVSDRVLLTVREPPGERDLKEAD